MSQKWTLNPLVKEHALSYESADVELSRVLLCTGMATYTETTIWMITMI